MRADLAAVTGSLRDRHLPVAPAGKAPLRKAARPALPVGGGRGRSGERMPEEGEGANPRKERGQQ